MTQTALNQDLQVLQEEIAKMDRKEKNHERYIKRKWTDAYNLDKLENGFDNELEEGIPLRILNILHSQDWIDLIFSKRFQDLHELLSDDKLCEIVKNLNDKRKEVLFLCYVQGYKASEIAQMKGVSERNVRKLRASALEEIRIKYDENNLNIDFKRQKMYNSNNKIDKCNYMGNKK